jgi:uncharacterized protein involved in type VI secretion and phage assembly
MMKDATGLPNAAESRLFGLYPALVTDIVDPEQRGRVEVTFPWLGDDESEVRMWATLLSPYADHDQGFVVFPAVGTQVVVGFEFGDLRQPYLVGSCWTGRAAMPVDPTPSNDRRVIKTRSGAVLEFDDIVDAARVTLASSQGHTVTLDDGARTLEVRHADGSTVTFTPGGTITVQANVTVEVSATALNVHAPIAVFDGIVTCTNLVASDGVASPSYTPGVGNIL